VWAWGSEPELKPADILSFLPHFPRGSGSKPLSGMIVRKDNFSMPWLPRSDPCVSRCALWRCWWWPRHQKLRSPAWPRLKLVSSSALFTSTGTAQLIAGMRPDTTPKAPKGPAKNSRPSKHSHSWSWTIDWPAQVAWFQVGSAGWQRPCAAARAERGCSAWWGWRCCHRQALDRSLGGHGAIPLPRAGLISQWWSGRLSSNAKRSGRSSRTVWCWCSSCSSCWCSGRSRLRTAAIYACPPSGRTT